MTLAALNTPTDDLLEAYIAHCAVMAPSPGQLRGYIRAAETFQADHPDLGEWMTRPVDARLVELSRRTNSWPFVFFALLSGRCRGDLDFLVAKKFGHTGGRTVAALYPSDVTRLRDAARRIGHSDASFNNLLGGVIPLAIAHFAVPPSALRVDDLAALVAFTESSPRLTAAMRRGRHSQLFRLRQLLFQADMTEDPPPRRREGGPATRAQRLSAVPSAGVRHSILAYLEARSAVVRPKTLDKLTSALAIFGEFIGEHFPELDSLGALERHHVEAFLTWTSTRRLSATPGRRSPGRPLRPGPCSLHLAQLLGRHRGVGLGRGTYASSRVLDRHPSPTRDPAPGPPTRCRQSPYGCGRRPR